jgi:hypothetical protein
MMFGGIADAITTLRELGRKAELHHIGTKIVRAAPISPTRADEQIRPRGQEVMPTIVTPAGSAMVGGGSRL